MPGRQVRLERSRTCAPARGDSLPTCLIRSRSTAMTTSVSTWSDLPLNNAPQRMYTGPAGAGGTSFTGRGALAVPSAIFWASANPDNPNKQRTRENHFSMAQTPERNVGSSRTMINRPYAPQVSARYYNTLADGRVGRRE